MQRIGTYGRRIIQILVLTIFIALLVLIDQITKYYFANYFCCNPLYKLDVIPNFFYFTYSENTGAAWSFLQDVSWAQTFFIVITITALVAFVGILLYSLKGSRWLRISLVFVIAGALGNLIDRILNGFVIDFIGFSFASWDFPIFNIADSFLVVGVIMVIIYCLFISKNAIFRKSDAKK